MISEPEPAKAAAAKAKAVNKAVRKRRSAPVARSASVASSAPVTGDKIKMIRGKAYPSPFTRLSSRVRRRKAFAQNRLVGPGEDAGIGSVPMLQRLLIAAGYLPTGEDDGNYGSKTYSAIRNLQKDLIRAGDLPRLNSKGRSNADGIYGKDTNQALKTGKSGIFQRAVNYKNAKRKFEKDVGTGSMTKADGTVVDNSVGANFQRFLQNPNAAARKQFPLTQRFLKNQTTKENKENTMKKINEIAMGHDMMEFEAEERARDAQSEQGANALSILQGLIDGGKITADELEQAAAMLRKGEEEAERKMPGNQGFSKKEQDAMSDEEYDAYFRMNETSHGSFTVNQKVTYNGEPATIKVVDGPGKGKDNRVIITQGGKDKSVKASEITTSSTAEEKTDAAKNESKVQTPEQENTLYESRFNNRNNQLFDKLINKWTK
jgi:peptidoglycan hydrolase-like protein with peptidoglycan-binding domain